MLLFEIVGTEKNPIYEDLSIDNLERQYDFLRSIVNAAVKVPHPMISPAIIKALNFHAIACLHVHAGEYRPCAVTVGEYLPPDHHRVAKLMNHFISQVNNIWHQTDPISLAAFSLWMLNRIHPFINGNGRTARALCYFIICVKLGGWLRGETVLPELIRRNRDEYVGLLKGVDASMEAGALDLTQLHGFLARLLDEQLKTVKDEPEAPAAMA